MKRAVRKAKGSAPVADEDDAPAVKTRGRPKKEAVGKTKAKAQPKSKAPATKSKAATATRKKVAKPADSVVDGSAATVKPTLKRKAPVEDETAAPAKKVKTLTKGAVLQEPPTQRLHVYGFGTGDGAELGFGSGKKTKVIKRPRLNPHLAAATVGVVQVAAGGMHCVALTADNKILTWGVNDEGALGRDTTWSGGWKDADANNDSDEESGDEDDGFDLNPKESTPTEVDWSSTDIAEGTRFVQVTAGDSASFVLTDDGLVYGWGAFRDNAGDKSFTENAKQATRPVLIPGLEKIMQVRAGANHALAMNSAGVVFAWGTYEQSQLGRRIVERTKHRAILPTEVGLPKGVKNRIVSIETGSYHNFAISKNGDVYAWGLNNYGETGIIDNAGQDGAIIVPARVVKSLRGKNVVSIKGGAHHSLAATEDGECLVWGRIDGHQMGIPDETLAKFDDDVFIKDDQDRRRILAVPQKIAIDGAAALVSTSSDHSIVITKEGKAWSWGFSSGFQTGLGTEDDVTAATMIDNTAVRETHLNGAATGGQFSIVTAPAELKMVNGA